jgi:hypothetical protein
MPNIKELEQEIDGLEADKFMYFCNDQYDVCDEIDEEIKEKCKELEILLSQQNKEI